MTPATAGGKFRRPFFHKLPQNQRSEMLASFDRTDMTNTRIPIEFYSLILTAADASGGGA